jgi:hypothetical protein
MGIGDVSRASMSAVNKIILDSASRFQRRIKSYVEQFMLNELLEEGGFDSFDEANKVELFIPEIDLDDKIRKEFHITSLWQANLLTEDESRQGLGRDPMNQSEFNKTFFAKITIPKIEAQAKAQAEAAAILAGVSEETSASKEGERIGAPAPSKQAEQRALPRNQYGTKRRGGEAKRGVDVDFSVKLEDFISEYKNIIINQIDAASADISDAMATGTDDPYSANMNISTTISMESSSKLLIKVFEQALEDGESPNASNIFAEYLASIHGENGKIVQNFYKSTTLLLEDYGIDHSPDYVFDGIGFKIDLLSSWMVQKTYWLGIALSYKDKGVEEIRIIKDGAVLETFSLSEVNFKEVPPYDYMSLYKTNTV